MMRFGTWRLLGSILLLPFVVVVVVPMWILAAWAAVDVRWVQTSLEPVAYGVGSLVFVVGLGLFAWCVVLFARIGQGTLAPWDPTRRLVTVGPYAYVRNPMISGVAVMLVGEAAVFGSGLLAAWSVSFILVNHIYFVLAEEPGLRRRFGAAYVEYSARVPRWLPRKPH